MYALLVVASMMAKADTVDSTFVVKGESRSLQLSVDKATFDARVRIVRDMKGWTCIIPKRDISTKGEVFVASVTVFCSKEK